MKRPALFLLLLTTSCSSIRYDDPGRVETLTIDYGSTDLQTLAGEMVESLVAAPQLNYLDNSGKTDDKRVIVLTGSVENRTSEHIRSEEHTSELQSQSNLVCRLLLEKKNKKNIKSITHNTKTNH